MQAYAASFFVIPAVRWVLNEQRNAGIKRANQARLDSLRALRSVSLLYAYIVVIFYGTAWRTHQSKSIRCCVTSY